MKFVVLDWLCICVFPLHTHKSIDSITFTHAVLLYITWYSMQQWVPETDSDFRATPLKPKLNINLVNNEYFHTDVST